MEKQNEERRRYIHHVIKGLEARALERRPLALKFADEMTEFFGSLHFLILNLVIFIFWILINSGWIPIFTPFDPFPFQMLTTVVSLEAIILTTIVLMSQNRQSLISSLREEVDIQINLISEREITKILTLLSKILEKEGIKVDDKELKEMLKEIDESYIERRLVQQLAERAPHLMKK